MFFLVNFPYNSPQGTLRCLPEHEDVLAWATRDGIGFTSAISNHQAAVSLVWHDNAPADVPDGAPIDGLHLYSPQIALITTVGGTEHVFPAPAQGPISGVVTYTGREKTIAAVNASAPVTTTATERWTVHLWPDSSDAC